MGNRSSPGGTWSTYRPVAMFGSASSSLISPARRSSTATSLTRRHGDDGDGGDDLIPVGSWQKKAPSPQWEVLRPTGGADAGGECQCLRCQPGVVSRDSVISITGT